MREQQKERWVINDAKLTDFQCKDKYQHLECCTLALRSVAGMEASHGARGEHAGMNGLRKSPTRILLP